MDSTSDFVIAFCAIGIILLLFALGYLTRIEGYLRNMKDQQAEVQKMTNENNENR